MATGANTIELEINVYDDDPTSLCVNHGTGDSDAPSLVDYLHQLHDDVVADTSRQLALVVFDCKFSDRNLGVDLVKAVREQLTYDTGLKVIYSVADWYHLATFELVGHMVSPDPVNHGHGISEGLMIDGENDAARVSGWVLSDVFHQGFGNGISVANSVLGPNVRPSMEYACARRAANEDLKFIYAWTVNSDDDLREYIRIGVDGLITDDVGELSEIVRSEFAGIIRMARREDNPHQPVNTAYGLVIKTADNYGAGTDANLTFTVTGSLGSASVTIDSSLPGRMETDETNFVTLQAPDLGNLWSMTVQRDDQGAGPNWDLAWIQVRSFRYGFN
jgi:glycerophosphoryl diester phosphodiesterase